VPAADEGVQDGAETTSMAATGSPSVPVSAATSQHLPDSVSSLAMSVSDIDDLIPFLEELLDESSQGSEIQQVVSSDIVSSMTLGGM
jgi:hypothetical protein